MKRVRNPVPLLVGLTALLALTCGIREDELRCEEAAARLADCCPGFDPRLVDCYFTSACETSYPVIDIDESRCLSARTCEQIVAAGICERAQAAGRDDGRRICP